MLLADELECFAGKWGRNGELRVSAESAITYYVVIVIVTENVI